MGDKNNSTPQGYERPLTPPTPSQAEGDERTVDKALKNAEGASSTKTDGDKSANSNSGADI